MRWILPVVAVTAIVGTMTASYAAGSPGHSDGARSADTPERAAERIAVVGENQRLLISSADSARAGDYWNTDRMLKAKPMPLPDSADKGAK
jgi:hypothetical protein